MSTENSKFISIILPSYNGEVYLKDSINSILNQSYSNWELILVDDCSTDNTLTIMQEYARKFPERIHVIQHETNRKLPAALNTGFAVSKGDYLTWTSDDNCYKPHAFEVMSSFLEENSSIGLVYSDYSIINKGGKKKFIEALPPEEILFKSIIGPCFLYTREVFEVIGNYSNEYFLAEDYEFFLRLAMKFPIAPIHRDLYYYRIHDNSLTSTREEEITKVLDELKLKYSHKIPFQVSSQVRSEGYKKIFTHCLKRKDFYNGIKAFLLMVWYNPIHIREVKKLLKLFLLPKKI